MKSIEHRSTFTPHFPMPFRALIIAGLLAVLMVSTFAAPHMASAASHTFRASLAGSKEIKSITFAADDGWVVLFGKNGYSTNNVPKELNDSLAKINDDGKEIKQVSFTSDSGWLVLFGKNGYDSNGLPTKLTDKLDKLNTDGKEIKSVAFTAADGWTILVDKNGYSSLNVPQTTTDKLDKLNADDAEIKQVVFMPSATGKTDADDEWVVVSNSNAFAWSDGVGEGLLTQLKKINTDSGAIQYIALGADGTWVVISDKDVVWSKGVSKDLIAKIKEISNG